MSSKSETKPDLVLYGGTFDPPHAGHTGCLRLVLAALPSAEVLVLPSAAPPDTAGVAKSPQATFADRVAMCKLAFADLGPRVRVETWENTLPAPNYTVQSLAHAAQLYPQRRLGFLVGQDQLEAFPTWREPLNILARAVLVVIGRRAVRSEASSLAKLRNSVEGLATKLSLALRWNDGQSLALLADDSAVLLLDGELSEAASHSVRADLIARRTIPAGWLDSQVERFIINHSLYAK